MTKREKKTTKKISKEAPKDEVLTRTEIFKELDTFKIKFTNLLKVVKRISNRADNYAIAAEKSLCEIENIFDKIVKRMESWEESMLFLMHNIKKNQFLYAHYPEGWVENYQSIKDGAKFENNWMTAKKVSQLQVGGIMPKIEIKHEDPRI